MTGDAVAEARAPGRVNLIGDHTDYNAGLALPMAIDLATVVRFTPNSSDRLLVVTTLDPTPAELPTDIAFDTHVLRSFGPAWAPLAAAIVSQARPASGGTCEVSSSLPTGAGLSSSASFCVALAMALGVDAPPPQMAELCRRAEAAVGSEVGLMDPLVISGARAGRGMLIDFADLNYEHVPVPSQADVVIVDSGERRALKDSPYAARRAECEAAAIQLGYPLGKAEEADIAGLPDPVLRRRTRHVVRECERVRNFAAALRAGDLAAAGDLMLESHLSLAWDFESSTPGIDELVESLVEVTGVHGARITGGGFGGCVVVLADAGALDSVSPGARAWKVTPAAGATVTGPGSDGT